MSRAARWTDPELRAALLMRRRGDSLREIAGACGKSVHSARKKLGELEALAAGTGRAGAATGDRRLAKTCCVGGLEDGGEEKRRGNA